MSRAYKKSADTGFTLVELLIVIGIILTLLTTVITLALRSRDAARNSANQLKMDSISRALDHYRNDFNALPPSSGSVYVDDDDSPDEQWFGCQFLAQAILGAASLDDGSPLVESSQITEKQPIKYDYNQGYGFRAKKRGQVYGPYIDPNNASGLFGVAGGGSEFRRAIIDYDKRPILYYLVDPSDPHRYNAADNSDGARYHTNKDIYIGGPGTSETGAGAASGSDVEDYVLRDSTVDIKDKTDLPEYLLCTQGADEIWWEPGLENPSTDDVTNLNVME